MSKTQDTATSWHEEPPYFTITLPRCQLTRPLDLIPTFKSHLLTSFNHKPASEDWAHVQPDVIPVAPVELHSGVLQAEYMPDANSIPRPDDLLLKPPYHVLVYVRGGDEIEVQASHPPTLQFLADYLRKWCRLNHQVSGKVRVSSPFYSLVYSSIF